MCLFTHCAVGALVGGATQNVGVAIVAGLASHAVLDAIPHYDYPDWRVELAGGGLTLLVLLLLPSASWPAAAGGLAGMLPDLEILLMKLGRIQRKSFLFPSHTGLITHGRECTARTLVWQLLLASACLAALGLVVPQPARAQTETREVERLDSPLQERTAALVVMDRPTTDLLAAEAGVTRLRVSFPVLRAEADWGSVTAERVEWRMPGYEGWDDAGNEVELAPVHRVVMAVPCRTRPQWRVTSLRWWREPSAEFVPSDLVMVSRPAICRKVPLVTVTVNPLAVSGGVLAELTLVLEHPPASVCADYWRAGLAAKDVSRNEHFPVPSNILNKEIFRTLQRGARQQRVEADPTRMRGTFKAATATVEDPFARTSHWLRLEVDQTGIYSLDGYRLSLLGVPTESVDPQRLRLFKGGGLPLAADPELPDSLQAARVGLTEVAIQVRGGADGWHSDDDILFYGFGGDTWLDRLDPAAPPLAHFEHLYDGRGIYWLTWEDYSTPSPFGGQPRRVPIVDAPPLGGQTVTEHQTRLHQEQSGIDWTGLLDDNWAWDIAIADAKLMSFELREPVPGSELFFVMDIRSVVKRRTNTSYPNQATAWLNNDLTGAVTINWFVGNQDDSLRVRCIGTSSDVHGGTNVLTLRNDNEPFGNSGKLALALDSFDVLYWTPLIKEQDQEQLPITHWGHQVAAPGSAVDLEIQLPTPEVQAWDVTVPDSAVVLRGTISVGPDNVLTLGLLRDPTDNRHLVLFSDADLLEPDALSLFDYLPTPLRANVTPADYVVIYDPRFGTAAGMLASLHSNTLPGFGNPRAIAVSEEDIYDNFSGGLKDPYALRNFLHWLFDHPDAPGRLVYVCWLGDASRDYRNYLNHDPNSQLYDFLPTAIRDDFPALPRTGYTSEPYASDDELVSFDLPPDGHPLDIPDLVSGRLTVVGAQEAIDTVQRIADYINAPAAGLWNNLVVMVADDLYQLDRPESGQHMRQAENCVDLYLPPSLDISKVYLVDYEIPPGSSNKPGARREAKRLLKQGTTIFHYVGHGSNAALADEQVLLIEDIYSLDNGPRRGVFIAFSCDVGIYESPVTQSMAEIFVSHAEGGAIASICASQVSWTSYNDQLAYAFYRDLYQDRAVSPTRTVAEALWGAKLFIGNHPTWGVSLPFMQNAQRYLFFGDPAVRLPNPVSSLVFAPASPDSLRGGARETVVVDLAGSGILPGSGVAYDLLVQESRKPMSATTGYGSMVYYWLPGAAAFRGAGVVQDQLLRIPFKVPTQLRYGESGKVRVIVETPDGEWAGADSIPVVTADLGEVDDLEGPAIDLSFEDGRYRVRAGTLLEATVQDTSGVSILGTYPSNSVLLEFDESGFMIDVSESFTFDPGSYTSGRVSTPLRGDMALGSHKAALHASDVLGNVGSDTLSFLLVAEGFAGIEDVTVYPNPTPGPCRLIFEISDPMLIDWGIFTLAGRRIRSMSENFSTAGPKILAWDGRDQWGDEIANGVYIYVLRGKSDLDEGRDVKQTGQLVIMK